MSELWWISVGGAKAEPARIVTSANETRTIYTIGCNDGTVYSDECGIELIRKIVDSPPLNSVENARSRKQWETNRKKGAWHNYRRFE